MGFWDTVASAGPYANNLHLVPDRQPHPHLITQFLQVGCWLEVDDKPVGECFRPGTDARTYERTHTRTDNPKT